MPYTPPDNRSMLPSLPANAPDRGWQIIDVDVPLGGLIKWLVKWTIASACVGIVLFAFWAFVFVHLFSSLTHKPEEKRTPQNPTPLPLAPRF